jgi:iron complex outermembrane receptor protein
MFVKKKTIILLFAVLIQVLAFAQENCISKFSGTVMSETGETLPSAFIVLQGGKFNVVSDNQGRFLLTGLCPGEYEVFVQYVGYKNQKFTITINGDTEHIIKLQTNITELSEVVVIQHHDSSQTEHATNFVLINEKQLAELAGKSLGESLKEVSGVNAIQTGPGIFKPVIHGVHSQRILILNYGIKQEGQQWGAEHAPEIDPFIASSIVVIKDASAIKYGTNALGGVIVVNPPPLPEKAGLGGTFNTVLQSNSRSGTFSGMLEGGIKNQDGWGWRVQSTGKRAGDFNTPGYSLTNTGVKELNFSTSTGYHKETAGFDIFFSHFQTTIGILKGTSIGNLDDLVNAMERPIPEYTSSFSYRISEPRQEVSHDLLKLNGHVQTQYGEWRLQYGFQNNSRKEFDFRIGDLSKKPAIDLKLYTNSLDAEWETLHSDKRTISVGVNTVLQNNINVYGTDRIPFIPNFNNISAGAFGITKLFLKAWTIDLGARYDFKYYDVKGYDFKNAYYSTSFNFNNVSAAAGATVRLKKNQTLNLNVSSAWRPPSVAELFSIGTHQSAAAIEYGLLLNDTSTEVMDIKEVNFKTEQAVKVVATYQRQWQNFTFEISPYVNYIFNYIYLRPEGVTKTLRGAFPYLRYTQTDALFLGADIAGTWHAGKHLKVIPRASLLSASDETNHDYLVFIPSNKYEVALRYERPVLSALRNFYLESKTKYVAKQNRAPRVVTVRQITEAEEQGIDPFQDDSSNFDFMAAPDGYWLWNLAAGVSVRSNKVQYDFRIASENTLNTSYREYTNRFRYYANDLGNNIIFSLKCIF